MSLLVTGESEWEDGQRLVRVVDALHQVNYTCYRPSGHDRCHGLFDVEVVEQRIGCVGGTGDVGDAPSAHSCDGACLSTEILSQKRRRVLPASVGAPVFSEHIWGLAEAHFLPVLFLMQMLAVVITCDCYTKKKAELKP